MVSVLVVFESRYGQASKIAQLVGELARRRRFAVKIVHADEAAGLELDDHDAVVIVAPVYFDRYPRGIEAFLRSHAGVLSAVPTAFVSVSNSAASADAGARMQAARMARTFLDEVRVRARLVATTGGAIAYPRYGVFVRRLMSLIATRTGGPTDTSRVHELTDWAALQQTLEPFLEALERPRASERPRPPKRTAPEESGVFRVLGPGVVSANE